MYRPRHFDISDPVIIRRIVDENSFALLMTFQPKPQIAHIPMIFDPSVGEKGRLIGHLAAMNPQSEVLAMGAEAIAVFQGPHAYVSPAWYASDDLVPTWNYAAVHVHGHVSAVTDHARAAELMDRLVARFEPDASTGWRVTKLSERKREAQMRGITMFELRITSIEAKVKMSQNRKSDDIAGVIENLSTSAREADRETASWMQFLRDV